MAGSYGHVTSQDGTFEFDLIENLGDAHEACEMMHYMVQYLARRVSRDNPQQIVTEAEESFYQYARGETEPDEWVPYPQ